MAKTNPVAPFKDSSSIRSRIRQEFVDELVKGYRNPEDLVGDTPLLPDLANRRVTQILGDTSARPRRPARSPLACNWRLDAVPRLYRYRIGGVLVAGE